MLTHDAITARPEQDETTQGYVAIWSQAQSENQWHRLFHFLCLLIIGGLAWIAWQGWMRPMERIYVRTDDAGRAMVVPGAAFTYKPSEASLKHFLTRFVHLHYARRKATVAQDLPDSLYFLADALANRTREEWQTTGMIKQIADSPYDLEVQVDNVVLRETERKPWMAEADYRLQTVDPYSRRVLKEQPYTATLHYFIADADARIPANVLIHNPIGLNITYVRTDESLRESR